MYGPSQPPSYGEIMTGHYTLEMLLKEHYHVFAHVQEFDFRTGG